MTQCDPTNPFTRDMSRALTATLPAQPDETDAEYAERFAAAANAFIALQPRDASEQMLASHIVAAQYAGLEALRRAQEADDPTIAERQCRAFAQMNRAMTTTMRLLETHRKRPDEALAATEPLAIEPLPRLRRRVPAPRPDEKPRKHAMHREKPDLLEDLTNEQIAKMPDEELNARLDACKALYIDAMLDPNHPNHEEAINIDPAAFPGGVIPVSAEEVEAERVRRRNAV